MTDDLPTPEDKAHIIPTDPEALMRECRAAHTALATACVSLQAIATGKLGNGKLAARKMIEILRRDHPVARDWLTDDPAQGRLLDELNRRR